MKKRGFKFYLKIAATGLGVFVAYCGYLASLPDREVVFVREVPTQAPLEMINQSIWSIGNWPKWFFSLAQAQKVNIAGQPYPLAEQSLLPGALIRLDFDPGKGPRKKFALLVRVNEYVQNQRISMSVIQDDTGRIFRLFDKLDWTIELAPGKLRATETARTRHWRSRVLTGLAQRTMMNQLLYPDVMALAQFTQPKAPNPYPIYGQ